MKKKDTYTFEKLNWCFRMLDRIKKVDADIKKKLGQKDISRKWLAELAIAVRSVARNPDGLGIDNLVRGMTLSKDFEDGEAKYTFWEENITNVLFPKWEHLRARTNNNFYVLSVQYRRETDDWLDDIMMGDCDTKFEIVAEDDIHAFDAILEVYLEQDPARFNWRVAKLTRVSKQGVGKSNNVDREDISQQFKEFASGIGVDAYPMLEAVP